MMFPTSSINPTQLDAVCLFSGVDHVVRAEALRSADWTRVDAGRQVFEQGGSADALYVLAVGRIKVTQGTAAGQEVLLNYVGPNEVFGCVAVCSDDSYPATATAVVDSWSLRWRRQDMAKLVADHPVIALNAVRYLARRLAETQMRLCELQTERVERRIAHNIVRLISQAGRNHPEGIDVDFPVSRQDVAEMAGTTLYTASRILSGWQQRGLVELGRQRVTVVDPLAIEEIAEDAAKRASPFGQTYKVARRSADPLCAG
ncbi:MAG: Crp/Fnr family transcriptional regulator [Kiloniellaceae bacterium]